MFRMYVNVLSYISCLFFCNSKSNKYSRISIRAMIFCLFLCQDKTTKLYTGDFYITRHSNLSEVHAVFHLVSDDSIRGDISSRHPVILSLRNIIKLCFRYDIMTLTIPLLLSHHMTEVSTVKFLKAEMPEIITLISAPDKKG